MPEHRPEHRPRILHTRAFWEAFSGCLNRYPSELQIASPYIGTLPGGFETIVRFAELLLKHGCTLVIVTRQPRSGEPEPGKAREGGLLYEYEAEKLESMEEVELLIHPGLHSKVYQFHFRQGDRASFVGSANFSLGGLQRNVETVAMFEHASDNDSVGRELERLKGPGAWPYNAWKIRRR